MSPLLPRSRPSPLPSSTPLPCPRPALTPRTTDHRTTRSGTIPAHPPAATRTQRIILRERRPAHPRSVRRRPRFQHPLWPHPTAHSMAVQDFEKTRMNAFLISLQPGINFFTPNTRPRPPRSRVPVPSISWTSRRIHVWVHHRASRGAQRVSVYSPAERRDGGGPVAKCGDG